MKSTVLIVDDSFTVRMDLDEAFREGGFDTALCATLATAREALSRTTFSLIVLDVMLPDGDGLELLKEIKKAPATASTPVMLLSSEAEVRDRIRGLRTGADEYVGKPYETAYLLGRARELAQTSLQADGKANAVLVIDDSPTFRTVLQGWLESTNFTVLTAASGEDGLHKAATFRPSVVIVDGQLPGIDGLTVIRRIKSDLTLRQTPCILLTATESHANEVRALEAGADAFVRKEAEKDVILTRLSAVLRATQNPAMPGKVASYLGPKKILAVDDSLTFLQELAAQMRAEGYDPVLAHSGEEALELLAVQPVDCILLDLLMPGLSGQETCKRIKNSPVWREIPLVMLTALEESEAMIAGINSGADDYITKTADFEILKARVRAQLRRKQFEDENRRMREQLIQKELEAAETRATKMLAETRALLLADLKAKNDELEAFSYSVSHDLRAPLRAIAGFSSILQSECASQLNEQGVHYLQRIERATERMSTLIGALLELSRVTRGKLAMESFDLTALAQSVIDEFKRNEPERKVEVVIAPGMRAFGDQTLLRIVLSNLLGNAWKYTNKQALAHIEIGTKPGDNGSIYYIKDNGAGFDMSRAENLFGPFQRLHSEKEFPGTGIGLATVQRIVRRHGGDVWAEGKLNEGAAFSFTLGKNAEGALA